ncbi:hypothetical protein ACFZCU_47610 [Streptomyces canus]|uniref:hypothetical protein n=1 Tax=Streptomyces canus TaxID=58343 RepID=UPI0036E7E875
MNGGTFLGGVVIVAGLFHGYLVIRLWRNPARAARLVDNFSSAFPYGDEFCRGMVRASTATTGGVTTAGLFAVVGQAAMAHQTGTLGQDLLDAMIASLVALFLFIALNMPSPSSTSRNGSHRPACATTSNRSSHSSWPSATGPPRRPPRLDRVLRAGAARAQAPGGDADVKTACLLYAERWPWAQALACASPTASRTRCRVTLIVTRRPGAADHARTRPSS